jgi:hypothetical protein
LVQNETVRPTVIVIVLGASSRRPGSGCCAALLDQGDADEEALAAFVQAAGVAAEVGDLDLRALATMNVAESHLKLAEGGVAREALSHAYAYTGSGDYARSAE